MSSDENLETDEKIVNDIVECVCCSAQGVPSPSELYRCKKCIEQKKGDRILCMECGKGGHNNKRNFDHDFDKNCVEVLRFTETQLVAKKKEGEILLYKAVAEYLTASTLEKFQKCSEIMISAIAGNAGSSSTVVAVTDLSLDVFNGIKNMKMTATACSKLSKLSTSISPVIKSSLVAAGIVCGAEFCYLGYKYWSGKISWDTLGREVVRCSSINAACIAGNTGGYVLGSAVGCAVGTVAGKGVGWAYGATVGSAVGPIGTVAGAVIGSIVFGIVSGVAVDALFKKYWPNEEQKAREKTIENALFNFSLTSQDLKNSEQSQKFNLRHLKKRYKELCRIHHPDKGGTTEGFLEINLEYGLLLAMLPNPNNNPVDDIIKTVLAIQMDPK